MDQHLRYLRRDRSKTRQPLTALSIFSTKSLESPSSTFACPIPFPLMRDVDRDLPPMIGRDSRKYQASGRMRVRRTIARSSGDGMLKGARWRR